MAIIDLLGALEKDAVSRGSVFVAEPAQVRSGRKNDFCVGQFSDKSVQVEFKIWEETIFSPLIPVSYTHLDVYKRQIQRT